MFQPDGQGVRNLRENLPFAHPTEHVNVTATVHNLPGPLP